jgi:methyl-accepting chemotaxis protein
MKFRRNAPALLIGMVIVVIVAVSIISSLIFSGMTASIEKSQFTVMKDTISFNLKGAEDKALARAAIIAEMPRTKERTVNWFVSKVKTRFNNPTYRGTTHDLQNRTN